MANQATVLAGMPAPRSGDAPHFSGDSSALFANFLHDYPALATANGLTDAQKVETISRYITPNLRKLWKGVDGYATSD
jgi:hypothetical protein